MRLYILATPREVFPLTVLPEEPHDYRPCSKTGSHNPKDVHLS